MDGWMDGLNDMTMSRTVASKCDLSTAWQRLVSVSSA